MSNVPDSWVIEFHTDARGRSPAIEFIDGLQPQARAVMVRAIGLLGEFGPKLSRPHTRQIEGKLWELKAGAGRVFYFFYIDRRIIILHGYRKRTQKAPRKEVDRAKRYMREYL